MKLQNLKLAGILLAVLSLTACIGDNITGVQNINYSQNGLTITGTASNCQVTTGTCVLNLNFNANNSNYNNQNIYYNIGGGSYQSIASCKNNGSSIANLGPVNQYQTTCTISFQLNNQSSQPALISLYNGSSYTSTASFQVGSN